MKCQQRKEGGGEVTSVDGQRKEERKAEGEKVRKTGAKRKKKNHSVQ